MTEITRAGTVMLDASANVPLRELVHEYDPVLYHDLFYEADDVLVRADFPPVPSWRRESAHLVGRAGDQIEVVHRRVPAPRPEVSQVRGVLAERVIVSTPLDPYLSMKALADYSGFSRRTLLAFMAQDNTLPHFRVNATGKIVVRRSDFDSWIAQFRRTQSAMDELIEQRRRDRALRRGRP